MHKAFCSSGAEALLECSLVHGSEPPWLGPSTPLADKQKNCWVLFIAYGTFFAQPFLCIMSRPKLTSEQHATYAHVVSRAARPRGRRRRRSGRTYIVASLRNRNDSWHSALRENCSKAAAVSGSSINCARRASQERPSFMGMGALPTPCTPCMEEKIVFCFLSRTEKMLRTYVPMMCRLALFYFFILLIIPHLLAFTDLPILDEDPVCLGEQMQTCYFAV